VGSTAQTVSSTGTWKSYRLSLPIRLFQFALFYPIEININDNRVITFRIRVRTIHVPIDDVVTIRTGGWFDANRFNGVVRFKQGKQTFVNRFSDFKDFLATVKDQNPTIVIEGF
jgi:hypothetical protein